MIIQGSNNPLVIQFDADVSGIPVIIVSLWNSKNTGNPIKVWTRNEMTISGDTAICPLEESETKALQNSQLVLEAKGLDSDGNTVFWDDYPISVKRRFDKIITLTQTGG